MRYGVIEGAYMKLLDSTLYEAEADLEQSSVTMGVARYHRLAEAATKRGDGASLQPADRLVAAWFPALENLILREQRAVMCGLAGVGRGIYGQFIIKLAPDKCAAITLSTILGMCLCAPDGVTTTRLAMAIADGCMAEWNVERIQKMKGAALEDLRHTSRCRYHPNRVNSVAAKHIACGRCARLEICDYALDPARWPIRVRAHIGAVFLNLCMAVAQIPGRKGQAFPAIAHRISARFRSGHKTYGMVSLTSEAKDVIDAGHAARQYLRPKYQPMVVKPGMWTATDKGGYLHLPVSLIKQTRNAAIPPVIHRAVNCLNSTPWRINKRILPIVQKLWETGGDIAAIPIKTKRTKPPIPEDFDRVADAKDNVTTCRATLAIYDDFTPNTAEEAANLDSARADLESAEAEYERVLSSKKAWKKSASAVYRLNAQEESERINFIMKLDVAQRMAEYERLYFPHQLDFRSRAYSVPLFLNHQGDDVCRGLLEFANPVNADGMGEYWLKIHLANSCGIDKVGFADRIRWVDSNADRFTRWLSDPLTHMDWTEVDKPFQALAAAYALDGDGAHLPIQIDGSNNALQHYAAMLRDEETAVLVNLIQSDTPQDFYADVAVDASRLVGIDASNGNKMAQELEEWVNRKLVKQTAMTVFYRVTNIGARRQLRAHLKKAGFAHERQYHASKYLAAIVLKAVSTTCPKVHSAMNWLSSCAEVVAESGEKVAWVTPLGLQVEQPYRRMKPVKCKTILQSIRLSIGGPDMPIAKRKQVQGFPPNFVHSIDAAHMMNTAVRCADAKIDFAGVHDSYWAHAGNIPVLNALIREEFVLLHNTPQLNALHTQLTERYPALAFPDVPEMGKLDVRKVLLSDYSFC